jgi:hypothetical protein
MTATKATLPGLPAARSRTILSRHVQFDYQNEIVYRDSVVPEALSAFDQALAGPGNREEQLATLSDLRNEFEPRSGKPSSSGQ